MEPKNYIELPADEHGNRACTNSQPLVIRAQKLGTSLKVIAPGSFLMKWNTVRASGWREVDAEPGPVSEEEWKRLVELCNLP